MDPSGNNKSTAGQQPNVAKNNESSAKEGTIPFESVRPASPDVELKAFNTVPPASLKPNSKKSSDELMKVVSNPNTGEHAWRKAWHELGERQEVEDKASDKKQVSIMTKVLICLICVVTAMLITIAGFIFYSAPAYPAAKTDFDKGVEFYLKDNYKDALASFQLAAKTAAKRDPKLHYYLALCHQALDDDTKAAAEYTLAVEQSDDPAFKEIVNERLARTKRRLTKATPPAEEKVEIAAKHDPVKKVIWFSTNWCSHCKKFKTAWEAGKEKYGKDLSFEHLNAEDPAAWKQVQTYKPKAYPTLVYLDGKNKVIENHADAPSTDDFIKHLQSLGAPKL